MGGPGFDAIARREICAAIERLVRNKEAAATHGRPALTTSRSCGRPLHRLVEEAVDPAASLSRLRLRLRIEASFQPTADRPELANKLLRPCRSLATMKIHDFNRYWPVASKEHRDEGQPDQLMLRHVVARKRAVSGRRASAQVR